MLFPKTIEKEKLVPQALDWRDARLFKPDSNACGSYLCVILYGNMIFLEMIKWMPTDGYTDGRWEVDDRTEVLYWAPTCFTDPTGQNKMLTGRLLGHLGQG